MLSSVGACPHKTPTIGQKAVLNMSDNTGNATDATSAESGKKAPDARKASLYIPLDLMAKVQEQSARLDRSVSWVVQRALKHSLDYIASLPSDSGDE